MSRKLRCYLILVTFATAFAKDPEPDLPPCPTNFQFLPQTLPMHCKMPSQPYPAPGLLPPLVPPFMPGPTPGKSANPAVPSPANPPVPAPFPPPMPMGAGPPLPMGPMPVGMPGMPMGMPGMPMGMPGMPMGMPGMPMGMPMVGPPPQSKLPVIVMPFYSPDPAYKDPRKDPRSPSESYKRKIRITKKSRHHHDHDTDTDRSNDNDSSSDTDSNDADSEYWNWKNRRSMSRRKKIKRAKKQDYLTPILQYVSKDGYVIFEKQISKGEAKDWLTENKDPNAETDNIYEASNKYEKDEEEINPNKIDKPTRDKIGESDRKIVNKNNQKRQRKPRPQTQQKIMNKQQE